MENLKFNIQHQLTLRPDLVDKINSEEELLQLITQYVQELVNHNFQELLRLLYRLDVSEQKVKQIVLEGGSENAAQNIARLILAREKEKMETRKKFGSEESNWEF